VHTIPRPPSRQPSGLRAAVDQHCKGCIYDSAVKGTWRAQVEACEIRRCPLHPYRPTTQPRSVGFDRKNGLPLTSAGKFEALRTGDAS
jgi:hypothetical protein